MLKKRELEITREMDEAKLAQQEAEKARKLFEEKRTTSMLRLLPKPTKPES